MSGESEAVDFTVAAIGRWGDKELARRAAWFDRHGGDLGRFAGDPAFEAMRETLRRRFGSDDFADFRGALFRGGDPITAPRPIARP